MGAAGGFCGWGDFAILIFPGVQQWLAGLESSQEVAWFDLRWCGNGAGTVMAVGGGGVAALWRWRVWFFLFLCGVCVCGVWCVRTSAPPCAQCHPARRRGSIQRHLNNPFAPISSTRALGGWPPGPRCWGVLSALKFVTANFKHKKSQLRQAAISWPCLVGSDLTSSEAERGKGASNAPAALLGSRQ